MFTYTDVYTYIHVNLAIVKETTKQSRPTIRQPLISECAFYLSVHSNFCALLFTSDLNTLCSL